MEVAWHGIVYENADLPGKPNKRWTGDDRDMGIAVFASTEAREAAIAWLRECGYRYFTEYGDAQGPGLSWAWRAGRCLRPSAAERLPSVRKARAEAAARDAFQRSLYKNPSYDLVNL